MRRVIVTLLICVFALGMNAQDMTSVFTAMPRPIHSSIGARLAKGFGGSLYFRKRIPAEKYDEWLFLPAKANERLPLLQTTERSTVEMKLLPLVNNTYVVCMISTVNGPVPIAVSSFSRPIGSLWQHPIYSRSQLPIGISSREWIRKTKPIKRPPLTFDMDLIQYRLSPDDQTLTAIYTTPQYLSQEAREKIEPYLSEPKVYTWQKYHFQ